MTAVRANIPAPTKAGLGLLFAFVHYRPSLPESGSFRNSGRSDLFIVCAHDSTISPRSPRQSFRAAAGQTTFRRAVKRLGASNWWRSWNSLGRSALQSAFDEGGVRGNSILYTH